MVPFFPWCVPVWPEAQQVVNIIYNIIGYVHVDPNSRGRSVSHVAYRVSSHNPERIRPAGVPLMAPGKPDDPLLNATIRKR
ncbi:MAG: hypothetical protein LPJ93_11785, partial [Rhodobacterales bacterium]|nr:hypothetical protein [Rhodobacterales bacterium]